MSEWKKCTIGDMVTLRQGFAINAKSKHYISKEPTSLALLRIADMKSGSREIYVKEDIPINFIAQPQDIVYTRTGNVGLVFRNNYGVVHNNCFTVTPNDARVLSRDFLYYLLQSKYFFEKANSLARGAAQPDLPHSLFNSIEISYPELDCQHRIATILSRYDSLIENYQKQIKLLEEAAQRLYKEWFVDLHFPGHENTKIVDGVPEGWEKTDINRVLTFHRGYDLTHKEFVDGPYPVVGSTSIIGNHNKFKIEGPGIVTGRSGSLGIYQLIWENFWPHNTSLYISDFKGHDVSYIYCMLKTVDFTTLNSGGAIPSLNRNTLSNISVLEPTMVLQESFSKEVTPMFMRQKMLLSQIRLLTEARDRLLPKLMSGGIAV